MTSHHYCILSNESKFTCCLNSVQTPYLWGFARFVQIVKLPPKRGKKDKIKIQNTLSTFSSTHQPKSQCLFEKSILSCVFL
jgi:hypothetical protein